MGAQPDRAASIFDAAVELGTAAERAAYLDAACGQDAQLRAEVEGLLEHDDAAGSFLNLSARPNPQATADEPAVSERPGTVIGPYKLLEQIGEGGFGVVFMAEQTQPVRRKVALKVLKPGMDTRQVVARFEAERQALALMDHPHIAHILDGGETASGRPYFVMELVRGIPITEFCDQSHLPVRERLELFLSVCQAVQHAHHKGIIHRDLKPSNVLVTRHDDKAVVKVIDFGIAKATGQQLTDKTLFTNFAQMIGTPLYMSPEQAQMSGLDVDTRSDVYSLGVLLYELLTGTTPFDKERLREVGYDEIRRIIREEEPARPSTRLSTLAQAATTASANRQSDPKRLSQLLRGELDWIVMKALEKDRNRRYDTANAFALDVQRYLADEPVQACPPSAGYRLRKFARRNRGRLAAVAVLGGALLVAVGGVAWAFGWANRDREARQAAVEQEVDLAVKEAERWQQQRNWPEALSAAKRAEGWLAGGGSEALRERVRELRRDVEMVLSLEDAWIVGSDRASGIGPTAGGDAMEAAYLKAFRDYGIDVEALPADRAAELIRARPIRQQLTEALDAWESSRVRKREDKLEDKLLAIVRAADSDEWRNRLRDARSAKDTKARAEAWAQWRASVWGRDLPPSTLFILASGEIGLLREAQQRYPGDFRITYDLATTLRHSNDIRPWGEFFQEPRGTALTGDGAGRWVHPDSGPQPWDEVVRFYSLALALRPGSRPVMVHLGNALCQNGRPEEALAYFRKAIDLDPKDHWAGLAHISLGNALYQMRRLDESIASYRKVLELDSTSPGWKSNAQYYVGHALMEKGDLDGAIASYRKASEINRKDTPAGSRVNPLFDNAIAIALEQKGEIDQAIAIFQKIVAAGSDDAVHYVNLGNTLWRKGRRDEAITCWQKAVELDPKCAPAYNGLGAALLDKGQIDEAIASFRKAIKLDTKLAEAYSGLGGALLEKGQINEAVANGQKAVDLDPKQAVLHTNLGHGLYKQGKLDDAIASYRKAIEIDPKFADAYNRLGNALQDKGRTDEAIASYRKAIEINPQGAVYHFNLGRSLHRKPGKLDDAIASYRKAIELGPKEPRFPLNLGNALYSQGKLDDAIACYRKAIEIDLKYAPAYSGLGTLLLNTGKIDEAIANYQKASDLDPKSAVYRCKLGDALRRKQGKLDEAIACYQKAVDLDPNYAEAYNMLGTLLLNTGKIDQAIACFQKLVDLDPNLFSNHANLGQALRRRGRRDEAIACFQRAIARNPKYGFGYSVLGGLLLEKGETDEAITSYQKAIDLDPNSFVYHENLGRALRAKGRPDDAIACYRKAIALSPKYDSGYFMLGLALLDKGQIDEAIASYQKAIELQPNAFYYSTSFGEALRKKGRPDEAITCFQKAIALNPKNFPAHNGLGIALVDKGEIDEAIASFRKAVEVVPNFAFSQTALALAETLREAPRLKPDDPEAQYRLGAAYARLGRWKEAGAAFDRGLKLNPTDHERWCQAAALHAVTGDVEGYRRTCRELVQRFGDTDLPQRAERTAKVCLLLPDALSAADFDRVQKLLNEPAVTGTDNNQDGYYALFVLARGLTEYRAGRHTDAVLWLERSYPQPGGLTAIKFAVLAMAHHRLGRAKEAEAALANAKAIVARMPDPAGFRLFGAGDWHDWLHAQVLCREAEGLLKKESGVKSQESGKKPD